MAAGDIDRTLRDDAVLLVVVVVVEVVVVVLVLVVGVSLMW